jgi:hypothetical protein
MASHKPLRLLLSIAFLIAAAVSASSAADAEQGLSLRASPQTGVPLIYFYHGMVVDENLNEIPPTVSNASRLLRWFSEGVASRSSDEARLEFNQKLRESHASMPMDDGTEALLYAALSRWVLATQDLPQEDSLDAMLGALETWATIPSRRTVDLELAGNTRLGQLLAQLDLDVSREAPPATTEYIEKCRSEQVPIPPDWEDPRWKLLYPLDPNYSFVADANSIAQVWVYEDPSVPGLCVGLPRHDKITDEIGLFGIICQGRTTGKACFWDNIDADTHVRLTPEESKHLKIAAVENGSMIDENCTNCHRGENVFVIHPRTALDLRALFKTEPDVAWYSPISGQPTWGNPGPIAGLSRRECNSCHDLPELAEDNNTSTDQTKVSAYCRILRQVVDKTMPPSGDPAGWLNPHDRHKHDVDYLRDKCAQ